ncbi:MAG: DUF2846 domain-containing protein [Desulfovibrio sp.]|nr:DUF2846 domain-containing protein [Desulfovibrio sp.]
MRKIIHVLLAVVVIGVMGCAKMPLRADYVYETTPQIVTADATSAAVYFLRESAFVGGGISYFIFEDATKIGLLKSGTYFVYKAMPGKHTYWAETEGKSSVTLDVQAGQTYYIEGGIGIGFWAGRPQLSEVTRPVAERILPELKYVRLSTEEEAAQIRAKEAGRQ